MRQKVNAAASSMMLTQLVTKYQIRALVMEASAMVLKIMRKVIDKIESISHKASLGIASKWFIFMSQRVCAK